MNNQTVKIVGAGLAGCECALQLAKHGIKVKLFDMKPQKMSPAHKNKNFCELVCSNTLKSTSLEFASGLLKAEMKELGSEVLKSAENCKVPAGDALAVDRDKFAQEVTDKILSNKNIEVVHDEVLTIGANDITVIATGPLTSDGLARELEKHIGQRLYFYDALAPIVDAQSIDKSKTFAEDRWGQGDGDYINCPLTKEEYEIFWKELTLAQRVELKDFEKEKNFEGCLPVEVMAKRDFDALRFGPMKPVGFKQQKPFAVLQLRKENLEASMYNLVGFQTNLTYPEQKRVFSLVPALKNAKFLRYGAMHRNSYINAPKFLDNKFRLKTNQNVYFAGQISGVEGYVESIASGLLVAMFVFEQLSNKNLFKFSTNTALGGLCNYLVSASEHNFQPMHINWGLMAPIEAPKNKKHEEMTKRSLNELKEISKLWNN